MILSISHRERRPYSFSFSPFLSNLLVYRLIAGWKFWFWWSYRLVTENDAFIHFLFLPSSNLLVKINCRLKVLVLVILSISHRERRPYSFSCFSFPHLLLSFGRSWTLQWLCRKGPADVRTPLVTHCQQLSVRYNSPFGSNLIAAQVDYAVSIFASDSAQPAAKSAA